jgi:hypothetical protein
MVLRKTDADPSSIQQKPTRQNWSTGSSAELIGYRLVSTKDEAIMAIHEASSCTRDDGLELETTISDADLLRFCVVSTHCHQSADIERAVAKLQRMMDPKESTLRYEYKRDIGRVVRSGSAVMY